MKRLFVPMLMSVLISMLLSACDQDPFHQSERKIAGDYYLQRWEDGKTYYIEARNSPEKSDEGGGAINGTVEKIGWNADYILVKRRSTFQGDPNGWMLLSTKDTSVKGPYTDEAIAKMPEAAGMQFLDAATAWQNLR